MKLDVKNVLNWNEELALASMRSQMTMIIKSLSFGGLLVAVTSPDSVNRLS